MAEQFSGTVEILNNSSGSPTVILEGGDDESGGNLTLGGQGQSGDLILLDERGQQRLFASGNLARSFLRLQNELGEIQVVLEGDTGNIKISGKLSLGGVGLSERPKGSVNVGTGSITRSYAQNQLHEALPIAFGTIWFDGSTVGGTGNFIASWDSVSKCYFIKVTGEEITRSHHVIMVTPLTGTWNFLADALNNQAKVMLKDRNDNRTQGTFQFLIFKSQNLEK